MEAVTLTPHLGYNTAETLAAFWGDMPEAIAAFAAGAPIRLANPEVLAKPAASVERIGVEGVRGRRPRASAAGVRFEKVPVRRAEGERRAGNCV